MVAGDDVGAVTRGEGDAGRHIEEEQVYGTRRSGFALIQGMHTSRARFVRFGGALYPANWPPRRKVQRTSPSALLRGAC
jgi:hypothetical protein